MLHHLSRNKLHMHLIKHMAPLLSLISKLEEQVNNTLDISRLDSINNILSKAMIDQ